MFVWSQPEPQQLLLYETSVTHARAAREDFFHVWLLQLYQAELGTDKKSRFGHLCLVGAVKVPAKLFGSDGHKLI